MGAGRELAIVAAFVAFATTPAFAWDTQVVGTGPGRGVAQSLATAANGDVIASGLLDQGGADGMQFVVVRLDGTTGAERWRTIVTNPTFSPSNAGAGVTSVVTVDGAGDVVMAASNVVPSAGLAPVVKLAGDTGALRWRRELPDRRPVGIVIDAANDAYVALAGHFLVSSFAVVKLAAATGVPAWTFEHDGEAAALAKLPNGDPIVVGSFPNELPVDLPPTGAVVRLGHATGMPVWTQTLAQELGVPGTVAAVGDVVYVGDGGEYRTHTLSPPGTAVALSAATGAVAWSRPFPAFQSIARITTTPAGDAAILGEDVQVVYQPFVLRVALHTYVLARADGAVLAGGRIEPKPALGDPSAWSAALVVDPSGDVSVVGSFHAFDLVVSRRGAPDLHEIWRRDGGDAAAVPGIFLPETAVAGPTGSLVVAGGRRPSNDADDRFTIFTMDAATGTIHACGDGIVDPGEACDDGGTQGDDCCPGDCKAAAPDGTACDDGSICTTNDRCIDGTCAGGDPLPCEPCGECHSTTGCFVEVSTTCGQSTITNGSQITIARPRRGGDRFAWSLRSGPATAKSDFGNPLDTSGYALCASVPSGKLVLRAVAPAGACGRRGRCWRSTRAGFQYFDPNAPEGLTHLSLHAGAAGKARWSAGGAHAMLLEPLPLDEELYVELRRLDDPTICWSATLPKVTKNSARKFRAKGR